MLAGNGECMLRTHALHMHAEHIYGVWVEVVRDISAISIHPVSCVGHSTSMDMAVQDSLSPSQADGHA